jgi:diaminopimelate epimerase
VKFVKMQGLGNDFILIEDIAKKIKDPAGLSRQLCRRRFSVGADGLVLLLPSEEADLEMRIFNPDGTEAEMCGNALRCVALYMQSRGLARGKQVEIKTKASLKKALLLPDGIVRVNMGEPLLESSAVPVAGIPRRVIAEEIAVSGEKYIFTAVSMGNPHCVIFLEAGRQVAISTIGPLLERHPLFPQGANIEFCRTRSPREVEVQVWERGAGETLACGTGACAVVVAGFLRGILEREALVCLPGGELKINWLDGGPVYMEGPAEEVFEGELPPMQRDAQ